MKMVPQAISVLIVVVIGVAVVIPVVSSLLPELEKQGLPDIISTIVAVLPIFVCIAMIMLVVGLFDFGDSETSDDDEEEEPEPVMVQRKKAQKSAYEILAERYAKGELSDEEYTERMARL